VNIFSDRARWRVGSPLTPEGGIDNLKRINELLRKVDSPDSYRDEVVISGLRPIILKNLIITKKHPYKIN